MAINLDTGALPVEPEAAATLLAAVFNSDAVAVVSPFERLKLVAYTVKVPLVDGSWIVFRIRREKGGARILVQVFR